MIFRSRWADLDAAASVGALMAHNDTPGGTRPMTEEPREPDQEPQDGDDQQGKFTAAYVENLRAEAAKYRKQAKTNADAAKRLADLEDTNKSEAEKQTGKINKLETDLAQAKREALKARVQARHGINDDDADLFLTADDEDTLNRQAERLTARESERVNNGNHVPTEGRTPNPPKPDDRREFADFLTGHRT